MTSERQSRPARASPDPLSAVRHYHQRTKHDPGRYAPGPGYLDWANQPDPFRRFAGARLVELPLAAVDDTPPYAVVHLAGAIEPRRLSLGSLGLFLELALGLTAWKAYEGTRWALRSNSSSGNLHPTEGYVLLPPVAGVSKRPGVYHYAPREHALEERCALTVAAWSSVAAGLPRGGFLLGLSSVHWREAWKYGERAYRYCQHDAGHALGSVCFAAAALGWRVKYLATASDAEVAALLGLDREDDFHEAEPEFPDLLAAVLPGVSAGFRPELADGVKEAARNGRWHGQANRLSPEHVIWPAITAVEAAVVKPRTSPPPSPAAAAGRVPRPAAPLQHAPGPSVATIIRRRRSAVAMDGRTGLSLEAFIGMLERTMPDPGCVPWEAFDMPPRIHLCLFVHRVEGLAAGLYMLVRDADRVDVLRQVCQQAFGWVRVEACALPLYRLGLGDCRNAAAYVSCIQDIAGDSAFALAMIADFARTLDEEGPAAYRRLFWEAGLVGHVLYLEAETAGVKATGIGCYFDDLVHRILGLDLGNDAWQSLYHFTVGGAVEDTRLTTLPAYHHLPPARTAHLRRPQESPRP